MPYSPNPYTSRSLQWSAQDVKWPLSSTCQEVCDAHDSTGKQAVADPLGIGNRGKSPRNCPVIRPGREDLASHKRPPPDAPVSTTARGGLVYPDRRFNSDAGRRHARVAANASS